VPEFPADDARFTAPLTVLQSLRSFSTRLLTIHTVDEVAQALMTDGVDAAGAAGGSLMIVQGTRLQLISGRNLGDDIRSAWNDFDIRPGLDPISDALTDHVPAFYADRSDFLRSYPHLQETIGPTPHHAWVVLPLVHDGNPIGSLGFTYEQPREFGTAEQLALLTIADLATQAVIRVLSAAEERQAFESLHAALLDLEIPRLHGVTTASAHLTAAKTSEAGGDWFNATDLSDGQLLFVIGDVAHHGTAAVGEMGRIRAVVLAYAVEEHPTNRIADLTTLTLSKLSSTFATACIVLYDPATRTLSWTNAGHPYPVVVPASGAAYLLEDTHGPPLGVETGTPYGRSARVLDAGDTVVLYSDGLIERRGHDIDADFTRLLAALPLDEPRPAGLVDELVARLHPSGLHDDDIAVLAITVS
jgi:serine phosphatase RsbU (regulator of sigma subunit)